MPGLNRNHDQPSEAADSANEASASVTGNAITALPEEGDEITKKRGKSNSVNWTKRLEVVYYIILAMGGILFLLLGVLSSHVNNTTPGRNGAAIPTGLNQVLLQASQFGPTIFPIVFAAALSCTSRLLARQRAERSGGSKIKTLELLVNSQSLCSTVLALFKLRRYDAPGFGLLAVWLLSPIGGQASLRVLSIRNATIPAEVSYQWLNSTATKSLFSSSNSNEEYNSTLNAVDAQYMMALITSYPNESCDNIGFPKTPAPATFNKSIPWKSVNFDGVPDHTLSRLPDTYESLLGVPTYFQDQDGDPSTMALSYNMSGTLFHFFCQSVNTYQLSSNWASMLENSTIIRRTSIVEDLAAQGAGFFIDTDTPFGSSLGQLPRHILFGSKYFSQITIADCSVISSETGYWATWNPQYCATVQYLQNRTWRAQTRLDERLTCTSIFDSWSQVGRVNGRSTPTEQFMATKFNSFPGPLNVDLSSLSATDFSQLLTMTFNTYWLSSQYPGFYSRPDGDWFQTEDDVIEKDFLSDLSIICMSGFPVSKMAYHPAWGPVLITISVILIMVPFYNIYLRTSTKGPDILGYVSSMTRHDPKYECAAAGMKLDGMGRARVIGDKMFSIDLDAPGGKPVFSVQRDTRLS